MFVNRLVFTDAGQPIVAKFLFGGILSEFLIKSIGMNVFIPSRYG